MCQGTGVKVTSNVYFHICDIYILVGTEVYRGGGADPFIIETNGESFILKSKMSVFALGKTCEHT